MWSSWSFGWDASNRCLVDSCASKIRACFVFGIVLHSQLFASVSWDGNCFFVPFLHGIAASIGTSNFVLAFFMVSLSSPCSGSMKQMPLNLRVLSSFGFSIAHYCFFSFWAAFPMMVHTSKPHILKSGKLLELLPISLQTTYIPLAVSLLMKRTLCTLSKNLTNFDSRPHSNNHPFVQHIQMCVSSPGYISVFQWNRECFFFRHIELNFGFIVMAIEEITLKTPKVSSGFTVICWFCRLRLYRFALHFSTEIFTPYKMFPPFLSGFSKIVVSAWQFCCVICWENKKLLLCRINTSYALILGRYISDASIFSHSSMSATRMSETFHR